MSALDGEPMMLRAITMLSMEALMLRRAISTPDFDTMMAEPDCALLVVTRRELLFLLMLAMFAIRDID